MSLISEQDSAPSVLRFGVFEADLRTGELRKRGVKIRLQEQPFRILATLLENPGATVTREELQARLWSAQICVAFEHGRETSAGTVRDAL